MPKPPKKRKPLYPGTEESERIKAAPPIEDDEPDWKDGAPNYDKFKGWPAEKVLAWLNID